MITENTTHAAEQYQDIFKRMAEAMQEHLELNAPVDEAKVREIVDAEIAKVTLPRAIEVHLDGMKVVKVEDRTHCQFQELLDLVGEGHKNLLLVGPAGTGKTTMAKHLAKALDLEYAFISLSAGVTETHLFGRMLPQADGTFAYVRTRFVDIYENGGVFLLDEMDAADSNVMVSINAALANGQLSNPIDGKVYHRHPKCIIIAAANTYGRGGDLMYVGRNALDAATLDRFVLGDTWVDYDRSLEDEMTRGLPADQYTALITWIAQLRERIASYKIKRVASTRLVERAVNALKAGRTLDQVKARFYKSWSKDELTKIGGAL